MKFLEDINFSENEFGVQVVVGLYDRWKEAARKFPVERLDEILKPSVDFAQKCIAELEERICLSGGEYGLMHISLLPERAGLDLFPEQNQYISHNLTRRIQAVGILPIIINYLKLLECVPKQKE